MVRIFKVDKLEERRRHLLEQSGLHRERLKDDVAGLKDAADNFRASWKKWAALAAVAGFLVTRRGRHNGSKPGLLSRLASGFRMAREAVSIVRNLRKPESEAGEHDGEPASRV